MDQKYGAIENINPVNNWAPTYVMGGSTYIIWAPTKGRPYVKVNGKLYQTISDYIINNPIKWLDDKFHTT